MENVKDYVYLNIYRILDWIEILIEVSKSYYWYYLFFICCQVGFYSIENFRILYGFGCAFYWILCLCEQDILHGSRGDLWSVSLMWVYFFLLRSSLNYVTTSFAGTTVETSIKRLRLFWIMITQESVDAISYHCRLK